MNVKLMKMVVALIAIVFTVMNVVLPANAAGEPQVVLFEHSEFQGRFQQLDAGAQRGMPIDPSLINQVSSIRVPPGVTVVLTNTRTGKAFSYDQDFSYVGDEMNDQADFIGITPECAPDAEVC